MNDTTARLALPFILPGQAQKEFYHNEALTRLDIACHPSVEGAPLATPPLTPSLGQSWIVASGGVGHWTGMDGALASWTEGGWRFLQPVDGMLAWNKSTGCWVHWRNDGWSDGELPAAALVVAGKKVVGERQPEVPTPSGGTTIDGEARAAIIALTAALKSHGLID
ncbi:MAG TPA: DUF2793 domain-containing protein [Allosphingosinicella sp.]|jgi:hypothetical protein